MKMELACNVSYTSAKQCTPLIGLTVHQLLEKRVNEHPDREMYVFVEDNERVTFKDFKNRVERLAAGLLSIGLKKGDRLAVWCNLHMEYQLFIAAARSIGVISVRIRPTFPQSIVKDIFLRTECKVLVLGRSPTDMYDRMKAITTASDDDEDTMIPHLDVVIGVGENNKSGTYSIDDIEKLGSDPKFIELFKLRTSEVKFDDDSDIYFTSGSTGLPKHVVHTHFSVINGNKSHYNYIDDMPNKENRRILARNSTHISGDSSGGMPPMVAGMTSVFPPSMYDIKRYVQAIQDERCTEAGFLITGLYDMLNFKDIDKYDTSSLSICITGGSTITPKLVKDFERKFGCTVLINYGSTEMNFSSMTPVWDPVETRCSGGRVLPNVEIQVVDDDGKCVPVGSVGEVWCRSFGIFQRYLGNEERTKAVKSPHGWFKTGDLGVLYESGILSIVGRTQDMIIKGGINILPADIENILSLHSSIDQVQVIGVPDERLGEEICVCARTKSNTTIDKDQIVAYLTGKVTDECIPGYVLVFKCFPKTDVGKIDRTGLKQQAIQRLENGMGV